jgi:glycosyltransferase involved in cell wall biosynthesis
MIVHISPSYKPAFVYGGTIASVSKLCEGLSKQGHDIQVLSTTANGSGELDVPTNTRMLVDGVQVLYCSRLSKDPMHFSIALLWQLYRIAKNESSLVVHIHSWWNFTAVLSLLMVKLLKVPTVLSPRGMLTCYTLDNGKTLLKKSFHRLMGKWLLQYPLLHATSLKEQRDILLLTRQKNIIVIPNLVHFPGTIQTSRTVSSSNCFELLFLSRIQEKKGLELLFQAVVELSFPWRLTVGGTGSPAYITALRQLAEKLNINESISWIGHVSNEDKYKCLANHDLLILPSHNENFGNVVLEALLSGTPVLITEGVGLSPYIRKTGLGWVSLFNKKSLIQNLIHARQDTTRRTHIQHTAPARVRQDFSENQLIQRYLQLYRKFV